MYFRYCSDPELSVEAVQFINLNNVNNISINIICGAKNVSQHENTHIKFVLCLILSQIDPIEM